MNRDLWLQAKHNYENGFRAHKHFNGDKVIYEGGRLVHTLQCDGDAAQWWALREYQDAERKKGTPIVLSHHGEIRWFQRDYSNFNFLTTDSNEPYILCDEARFTNFRWRAGYPKGGSNG